MRNKHELPAHLEPRRRRATDATWVPPSLNIRKAARALIADYRGDAAAEAQERLLLMYAIGSHHGVLNWLAILAELSAMRDQKRPACVLCGSADARQKVPH